MSCSRSFSDWLCRAVSALLLLVVAAHAVAPVEVENGRGRGSAFSASTAEVSLKAMRADVAKDLVRLDPALPPQPVFAPLFERSAAPRPAAFKPRAATDAFPDPALHPLSPRAPPLG